MKLTDYRLWVLRHWTVPGWCIIVDRLRTKKGFHEIKMLVGAGLLESDEFGLYRLTDAGRSALSEAEEGRGNG